MVLKTRSFANLYNNSVQKRPEGLEPPALGLEGQCSTIWARSAFFFFAFFFLCSKKARVITSWPADKPAIRDVILRLSFFLPLWIQIVLPTNQDVILSDFL